MKTGITIVLFLVGGLLPTTNGQSFVNLDFESAQVDPVSAEFPNAITAAGWTVYYQGQQQTNIYYNTPGAPTFYGSALEETNSRVLDGSFSLVLTYGAMISQTGTVPFGTESMFFSLYGTPYQFGTTFSVSIDGQNLPYYAESSAVNSDGNSYTTFAANVSAFSGQNVTLNFFTTRAGVIALPNWSLDDIGFSPLPVPEPGPFTLISFGAILFCCHCWRKLKSSLVQMNRKSGKSLNSQDGLNSCRHLHTQTDGFIPICTTKRITLRS